MTSNRNAVARHGVRPLRPHDFFTFSAPSHARQNHIRHHPNEIHSLYQAKTRCTRAIDGVFNRWRWVLVVITQLVFYGLPWLQWGERQMVLFDLGRGAFTCLAWCCTAGLHLP